ncbi:MAG: hypothetical protein IKH86_02980 [Prevotella sp.]|nr:hypothetical protein [Prevotella sp.]
MKKKFFCTICVICTICAICLTNASCHSDNSNQKADELLQTAQQQFDNKQYDAALATIDTLRSRYPKAIEARKKALLLHQEAELKRAEHELALTDSALQQTKSLYNSEKRKAEAAHANGTATAAQLTGVTLLRMKRDSLQVQFDMQCAKIKYIHKKQKEK